MDVATPYTAEVSYEIQVSANDVVAWVSASIVDAIKVLNILLID